MSTNYGLLKVNEWERLRGFSNLFRKEISAWRSTRRWMINTLLWTLLLGGLTAIILFAPGGEVNQATEAEITQAGGEIAYILSLGLSVFFEFGGPMLAIGTVILAQDLIIGEKQSGVTEWLLSKPVVRRSYVLAKLTANALPVLVLLVGLPSTVVYSLLSLRLGTLYPVVAFLSAVGILAVHTLFYLCLTLMLGTLFNNRGSILGIPLGSILGGGLLGGFIQPLFYVTPWMLPKVAWLTAAGQAIPTAMSIASLVATVLWSIGFIGAALVKFKKMEC